jgi:hypothetical protein
VIPIRRRRRQRWWFSLFGGNTKSKTEEEGNKKEKRGKKGMHWNEGRVKKEYGNESNYNTPALKILL